MSATPSMMPADHDHQVSLPIGSGSFRAAMFRADLHVQSKFPHLQHGLQDHPSYLAGTAIPRTNPPDLYCLALSR
jgi:hypothetical protein